jgi:hypothetical protein
VDEEIYRRLPAFLISTVDKFAQMPWKGAVQMLFGRVQAECERHGFVSPEIKDSDHKAWRGKLPSKLKDCLPLRPPDLIIQDELHLINGPLGSMVGLYESAIDHLCTWEVGGKKVRPKVVASTATIRRAREQVHALMVRDVRVFPPHGLDVSDQFFARQSPVSAESPGRRYLGICALGKRLKAALIRVYVAEMAAAQTLYNRYGRMADAWMTLVGYFNALRELAGQRRLVEDDIRSRLKKTADRGLSNRAIKNIKELTSRMSGAEIPRVLEALEWQFKPSEGDEKGKDVLPIDVLLATNMISVGVDVARLGVMVVAGQPKSTAEYIQATSRIGRRHPGLVLTVYNWARPRDLSHYERFGHYHATFYQHVEAMSVTPFASRALDRGLSGLLVSLVRLGDTSLNANEDAEKVTQQAAVVKEAMEVIRRRVEAVTEDQGQADKVEKMLAHRVDAWCHSAQQVGVHLGYERGKSGDTTPLLKRPDEGPWQKFTCLTSLRNVEASVPLILDEEANLGKQTNY